MKKLSHLTMQLAAFLALTSVAPAKPQEQPEEQKDKDKLVEMVREATAKYQDVANAIADKYTPVLG